ncbi:MAG: MAPEG family protein [Proteobacteria bacterium]|nr:MAPEG family protein [Pseudomonadota bacterium]MBI3498868.1 MAPEG family protein [Pseudomonadota bacterium]
MMLASYLWTALATVAALLVLLGVSIMVGRARSRYKIDAPAITGHADFERYFRVQQNTLEQIVFFLPSLWLASFTLGDRWAALGGAVWVVGRIVYARGYYQAADRRHVGFLIGTLAGLVLLAVAFIQIIRMLVG